MIHRAQVVLAAGMLLLLLVGAWGQATAPSMLRLGTAGTVTGNALICGNGEGDVGSTGNVVPIDLQNPATEVKGIQLHLSDNPDRLLVTSAAAVGRAGERHAGGFEYLRGVQIF